MRKTAFVWVVEVLLWIRRGCDWEPMRFAATRNLARAEQKRLAMAPARVRKYIREAA